MPIGARLGDFEVAGLLHRDDVGFLYVGADRTSLSRVAVKEYLPGRLADRMADGNIGVRSLRYQPAFRDGMQAFLRQSQMLSDLDEPALVKTLRTWEQRGTVYTAMPLYEGRSLNDMFRDAHPPSEAWLKAMLGPLLDALATLHRAGCYPCDVTPQNVVVGDGGPLLFDVGTIRRVVARATQGGTALLDSGYAAIEQLSCDPSMPEGPWTDVYAVASLLHLAITGKPPPSPLTRINSDDMPPLGKATIGYSESFLDAVGRGLAVHPQRRPQSIAEFREALGIRALERIANAVPVLEPAPFPAPAALAPIPPQGPEHSQAVEQGTQRTTGPERTSPPPKKQRLPSRAKPGQAARSKKAVQTRPAAQVSEQMPLPQVGAEEKPPLLLETTSERRFSVAGILGVALIVAGLTGFGLLWTFKAPEQLSTPADKAAYATPALPSEESNPAAATSALPAPTMAPPELAPASTAVDELAPARTVVNSTNVPTLAKTDAPAAKAGKIQFAIKPWGEIVVDGKKRGVSPPIKELSVPEGRHRIEIRNGAFPGYAGEVDINAGRKVSIVHSFTSP